MKKNIILLFIFSITSVMLLAQPSADYYNAADNKVGVQLKTALFGIITVHTDIGYGGLWTAYYTTDVKPNGKVWDIYSNCDFTFGTDQDTGNSGSSVCQKYNREHTFPASWYGDGGSYSKIMSHDLFNAYPTDKKVNSERGDLPYGEVVSGADTWGNSKKGYANSGLGYSGTVFEPNDEYKGDLARSYFYMVTCYEDQNLNQNGSNMLSDNATFETWAINMLLKWHKNDPVSQKEFDRNNAVFVIQHNRNPFIDHPELAEYIWGDSIGYVWHANSSSAVGDVELAKLEIYPNPASEWLMINDKLSMGGDLQIIDITGKVVLDNHLPSISNHSINISMLASGIYFIKIKSAAKIVVEKVVVK